MTDRKDFKRIVRDRSRRTGESYSSALRIVLGPTAGAPKGASDTVAPVAGGSFASRFAATRASLGPLVWGLDPSASLLEAWGLGDTPDGLDGFVDVVVDAAVGVVGVVKPQAAFYERHGWRGMRSLERLIQSARSAGLLVIVDAKRGDIGSTNDAYADAYLGPGSPFEADALTVHPYLGLEAMDALVARAHESASCLLVMVHSTNPEGHRLQSATDETGVSVEGAVLEEIGRRNAALAPGAIGPVGGVIGAGAAVPDLDLRAANALFLAPGIGAQGASAKDVARTFAPCPERVMPSASRALLESGPDRTRLRDVASAMQQDVRAVLSSTTPR